MFRNLSDDYFFSSSRISTSASSISGLLSACWMSRPLSLALLRRRLRALRRFSACAACSSAFLALISADVVAFESFFHRIDLALDVGDDVGRELVFVLIQGFLGAEGEGVRFVAHFDLLFALFVFFGMEFSIFDFRLISSSVRPDFASIGSFALCRSAYLSQRRAGSRLHRCRRRLRSAACRAELVGCLSGRTGRSLCCLSPFCAPLAGRRSSRQAGCRALSRRPVSSALGSSYCAR